MNIPEYILTEIFRHARAEFPNECCGWLTGPKDGDRVTNVRRAVNAYDPATHPTASDRTAETAYVMDLKDSWELDRSFNVPEPYVTYQFPSIPVVVRPQHEPPLVIYHSHPNGQAYFSTTDRKVATDPWTGEGPVYPVKQLVVGIDANCVVEARLFDWDDSEKGFAEVEKFSGAEI